MSGLRDNDPRHGTYGGYNSWKCRCEPCKAAAAARQKDYRHKTKGGTWAISLKARDRALRKLASAYPEEFARLHNVERELLGLPAVGEISSGRPKGPPMMSDDPRHGSLSGYQYHKCRCKACSKAHSDYQRSYRQRKQKS